MSEYSRIAIYYTPAPDDPLASVGLAWLGWDIFKAEFVEREVVGDLSLDKLTARPRKYGFHATLKAPFRLADGFDLDDLLKAARVFSEKTPAVEIGKLEISKLHGFLALRPIRQTDALTDLASQIVEAFDPLRAPMTEAERARRLKGNLSTRQIENLDRWGYPFVGEDFQFHMTLTGRLKSDQMESVKGQLDNKFSSEFQRPFTLDALTICGERSDGFFKVIEQVTLRKG